METGELWVAAGIAATVIGIISAVLIVMVRENRNLMTTLFEHFSSSLATQINSRFDVVETKIEANRTAIKDLDTKLSTQIEANRTAIKDLDTKLSTQIEANRTAIEVNTVSINRLDERVSLFRLHERIAVLEHRDQPVSEDALR